MTGRIDRRVAAVALAAAAAAFAGAAATSRAPLPAHAPTTGARDAAAFAGFLASNDIESPRWRVAYRFTRQVRGREIEGRVVEVRVGRLLIVTSLGTLTARGPRRSISCTRTRATGDTVHCLPVEGVSAAQRAYVQVLTFLVGSGRYAVRHLPERTVAGERARCFVLEQRVAGVSVGGFPPSVSSCYAADGVPLWSRVERGGAVDERTARSVRRGVGVRDARRLVRAFGADPRVLSRLGGGGPRAGTLAP